jgi:hypothetical protein
VTKDDETDASYCRFGYYSDNGRVFLSGFSEDEVVYSNAE